MTERYFTNSEIGTYMDCPRRWWLGYVLKLEPAKDRYHPPRIVGTVTHDALQAMYENEAKPLDIVRVWRSKLLFDYHEMVKDPDEEIIASINKDMDLAHAMVEGYIQWVEEEGVDIDYEVVATENEVAAPINMSAVTSPYEQVFLLGKLDLRVRRRSDGSRLFLDHKTVGDLVQLPKWAHMNTQVKMYHLLEYLTTEERSDGGIFNMLRKVKRTARANPPFYARHEVRHNIESLRMFWRQTYEKVARMLHLEQMLKEGGDPKILCPPVPSQECAWKCEFFSLCPMIDDGSDWEGLMGAAYRESDPLARYVNIEKG